MYIDLAKSVLMESYEESVSITAMETLQALPWPYRIERQIEAGIPYKI